MNCCSLNLLTEKQQNRRDYFCPVSSSFLWKCLQKSDCITPAVTALEFSVLSCGGLRRGSAVRSHGAHGAVQHIKAAGFNRLDLHRLRTLRLCPCALSSASLGALLYCQSISAAAIPTQQKAAVHSLSDFISHSLRVFLLPAEEMCMVLFSRLLCRAELTNISVK